MESKFKIGAWYLNPMMEHHGKVKARYTKVSEILVHESSDGSSFLELLFDECVMPDGTHYRSTDPFVVDTLKSSHGYKFSQSNCDYEDQMIEVSSEKMEMIILSAPYGI